MSGRHARADSASRLVLDEAQCKLLGDDLPDLGVAGLPGREGQLHDLGATEERLRFPSNEYDNIWVLTLEANGEADVVPLKFFVLPDCRDCECPECPEDPVDD